MRVFLVWTGSRMGYWTIERDVDSVWPDIVAAEARRAELFESNEFEQVWVNMAEWGPEMKESDFDPSPNLHLTP